MSKRIPIGELGEPSGSGKAPGLVVIQEWWGVNDHMKSLVDRFAAAGFLTLAPDLYHGKVIPNGKADEAGKAMTELDKAKAVSEIGAAVGFLKEHARSNGKVAVLGFCMGGALTFAAACNVPGLSAAVPFYGLPAGVPIDWSKATAPIQAHFATQDQWATVAGAEEIKKKIEAAKKTTMELHTYDAQHAFVNDTRPEVYSKANAELALERAIAFLKKHVS